MWEHFRLVRCPPCKMKDHLRCQGITTTGWCECPCFSGELLDPFVAGWGHDVPFPRRPL